MRPSKFKQDYIAIAQSLCEQGLTDVEIAHAFSVAGKTLYNWAQAHPEFLRALKVGKAEADNRVERSLYHRAIGYSHDAVKIFADPKTGKQKVVKYVEHYPPDTTAGIFWLKNRRPAEWRDKHEVVITDKRVIAEAAIEQYLSENPESTREQVIALARRYIPEVDELASELVQ